jgi:hypothetical protein
MTDLVKITEQKQSILDRALNRITPMYGFSIFIFGMVGLGACASFIVDNITKSGGHIFVTGTIGYGVVGIMIICGEYLIERYMMTGGTQ